MKCLSQVENTEYRIILKKLCLYVMFLLFFGFILIFFYFVAFCFFYLSLVGKRVGEMFIVV